MKVLQRIFLYLIFTMSLFPLDMVILSVDSVVSESRETNYAISRGFSLIAYEVLNKSGYFRIAEPGKAKILLSDNSIKVDFNEENNLDEYNAMAIKQALSLDYGVKFMVTDFSFSTNETDIGKQFMASVSSSVVLYSLSNAKIVMSNFVRREIFNKTNSLVVSPSSANFNSTLLADACREVIGVLAKQIAASLNYPPRFGIILRTNTTGDLFVSLGFDNGVIKDMRFSVYYINTNAISNFFASNSSISNSDTSIIGVKSPDTGKKTVLKTSKDGIVTEKEEAPKQPTMPSKLVFETSAYRHLFPYPNFSLSNIGLIEISESWEYYSRANILEGSNILPLMLIMEER